MIELPIYMSTVAVPYFTYEALEAYAESIIADYAPERLNSPGSFDSLDFLRKYLGLDVAFHRLSYDSKLLAITALNDDFVQILDDGTSYTVTIPIRAGTVVIDKSLETGKRNMPRLRFTAAHEGSHWLIHRKAFVKDGMKECECPLAGQFLAAKKGRIDYSRSKLNKTDSDRMERQADFLAAALLMPRPALRIAYRTFFAGLGVKPRPLTRGKGEKDDTLAKLLARSIAESFAVSRRAALIRLEKLGAISYKGSRIFTEFNDSNATVRVSINT